jgi:hypothetical protein
MSRKRVPHAMPAASPAWFQNNLKAFEIAMASPVVIAHRLSRMASAGTQPSVRDQREFTRMGQEKMEAAWESWAAMSAHAWRAQLDWTLGGWQRWWQLWSQQPVLGGPMERHWTEMWRKGMAPVHRRATANAARLGRIGSR